MRQTAKPQTTPPYLSVIDDGTGDPILMLTIEADALVVCAKCPHLHVKVMDVPGTSNGLRDFATSLRHWADRLDGAE